MKRMVLSLMLVFGVVAQVYAQAPQGPPPVQPRPTCTRQSLQSAVDSYLAAQKAGDRTKMAFADKVKYLQNMSEVAADKGMWNTAVPVAFSRSFLDKDRCRTFSEVIVTEGDTQYVMGTRLSVDNGRVVGIDSLVSHKGDWLFNANAYLNIRVTRTGRHLRRWRALPCKSSSTPPTAISTNSPTSSSKPLGGGRVHGSKGALTPIAVGIRTRPVRWVFPRECSISSIVTT
jgi:hypothetical protein